MPTVNKVSLREEFDACRERFHSLREQGKVSPECEVLFSGLLMLMQLMQLMLTVFMEKATRKGSRNSGLPSSQTPPDETATGRPGTKGKGPDPKVHDSASVRKVTETTVSAVTECSGCGLSWPGRKAPAMRGAR